MPRFHEETSAEKRLRIREEARATKLAVKADEAASRLATSATFKIDQIVVQLQTLLANDLFAAIPVVVAGPVSEALAKFEAWKQACKGVIDGTSSDQLPFDVKTLTLSLNKSKKDRRVRPHCGERLCRHVAVLHSHCGSAAECRAAQPPGAERLRRRLFVVMRVRTSRWLRPCWPRSPGRAVEPPSFAHRAAWARTHSPTCNL